MVRFEPYRFIRVFIMPMLALCENHIRPTQANAQEDIQHRAAEARGERHDREAEARDCNVCDEVAEGVADGEDGEA